jgi:hypothetical protein
MFAKIALLVLSQTEMTPMLQSWEVPSIEVVDDTPQVFAVSREQKRECPELGTVCMGPGGSDTVLGVEVADGRGPVTVLARGTQLAAREGVGQAAEEQAWHVALVARFSGRSQKAPVMVAFFDKDDQESIIENTPMIVWTVTMEPGRDLGMQLLLSPQDGFVPSRTYWVRVVQVVEDRVRSLAEGDVHLE